MDLSFSFFWQQVTSSPAVLITVFLTLCVIFLNGCTDAPNAIATCVSTRSLNVDAAIIMAAVCNFAGVFVMTMVNSTVAATITNMVNFSGHSDQALVALSAALFSIVVWSAVAWYFGIPTSESHSLIAGLSGAAIALQGGLSGINGSEWIKVLYGLVLSTVIGFFSGYFVCKFVAWLCRGMDRRRTDGFFRHAQVGGAAAMAFMHGAQDGQKFMGVLLLVICLSNGRENTAGVGMPVWLLLLCSLVIGIGTSAGGKKIIKSLVSTVFGIPVSTTHTKTTAIMGVGAVKRLSAINFKVVQDMALTWLLNFPGCGLIGFFMAKLFMVLF